MRSLRSRWQHSSLSMSRCTRAGVGKAWSKQTGCKDGPAAQSTSRWVSACVRLNQVSSRELWFGTLLFKDGDCKQGPYSAGLADQLRRMLCLRSQDLLSRRTAIRASQIASGRVWWASRYRGKGPRACASFKVSCVDPMSTPPRSAQYSTRQAKFTPASSFQARSLPTLGLLNGP